jgi:DEAD/DEAH box helicase domain-containing protein
MRVITWDLEICESPTDENGGWNAARNGGLGISCISLYDTASSRFYIYDQHTLDVCGEHLREADMLVGFNNLEFDTPCFEGLTKSVLDVPQYDILAEVRDVVGRFKKGYRLGQIAERTIGCQKTDTGEHAPVLFQQHRFAELHTYCMHDVAITRDLCNFIEQQGYIIGDNGEPVTLDRPGFAA